LVDQIPSCAAAPDGGIAAAPRHWGSTTYAPRR